MHAVRFFALPALISLAALVMLYFYGGFAAFVTAALLSVLEVTLSFDNAVVNARVLKRMSTVWQWRFLTWGILIAVFGTRLVLPIFIVSAVAWSSPVDVVYLALFSPDQYGHLLEEARYSINGFGGTFLLMVALRYFFDTAKKVHWIQVIEKHLAQWGRIEAIEIGLALTCLTILAFLTPEHHTADTLLAGIVGIVIFIIMEGITSAFSMETSSMVSHGLVLFIYLNILDSAFSLDSVVGAFALTTSLPIIAVGLGIGAYFVRSITIYLVQRRALDSLIFLEHGAHWAILGLAAAMYAGLLIEVPEIITGSIGLAFVLAAYYSSLMRGKKVVA